MRKTRRRRSRSATASSTSTRALITDLGHHVWTPEERARVLWSAMKGETARVVIALNPIEISVRSGDDLMAAIPCGSVAETMQ